MSSKLRVPVLVPIALAVALTVASCGQPETTKGDDGALSVSDGVAQEASAADVSPTVVETPSQPWVEPAPGEPAGTATDHRVTHDWADPSYPVTINHPAAAPTPYLVAIHAGNHPDEEPPYQRIAFSFRQGFPEYNLQYVRSVTSEGTGEPISLEGNGVLRIGFVNAQAHDETGKSTVSVAPATSIGYQNLKSYGSAGDFEGHVTYGLGIQVAPDSDQVLLVRAGELTKLDEAGGTHYVVYVDLQSG